jgi:hypothetical protein
MTPGRRAGAVAVAWFTLAGVAALYAGPALGTVRLGGISLLWGYGLALGPLLAGFAVAWLGAPGPAGLAAWIGPALLLTLGGAVHRGGAEAPTLVLLAVLAPAFAAAVGAAPPGSDPLVGTMALAAGLLLGWAGVATGVDLARALGGPGWLGGLLALALAGAAAPLLPERTRARLAAVGVVGLALPVAAVSVRLGVPPWRAWMETASRPVVVFSPSSPAVDPGLDISEPVVLRVSEPHRVTAAHDGSWRVREHDGERPIVREWALRAGQALVLRPGDELELPPGARVRFEAGRRVPGAPPSGVAWADATTRRGLGAVMAVLGAALALTGGAALLTDPRSRGGALGGALVVLAAWVPALWGIATARAAPELGLGAPPLAPLVRLPVALAGAPHGHLWLGALLLGLAALWAACAGALGARLESWLGAGPRAARLARAAAAVAVAALLGVLARPTHPGETLLLGAGLAATVCAPGLVGDAGRARRLGTVAALVAYAGAVAAAGDAGSWGSAVPAAPLGVLVGVGTTVALRPSRSAARGGRSPRPWVAPEGRPLRE